MNMESLTTEMIAVGAIVLNNASAESGKNLGKTFSAQLGKLVQLIRNKPMAKMQALLGTGDSMDAPNKLPADYSQAVQELQSQATKDPELTQAIQSVEATVRAEPELLQKVQKLATALNEEPTLIQNNAKLAEKIGIVVQGGTVNLGNMTF
jgi:polyhydroxyalkanoate synthesis regulator protein